MRLIQSMKRPIQVVIILTTVLSFLVPMAPAAIVLAADDGPQFTLDGFKWQDILGDKWGLYKSESRVDNNLSATNPWTINPTITFSSGHILWVSLRPLGQTEAISGIYVRIIWSPDTKTIAAYKDLWFQSLISEQNHDLNDTAHKQIGKEGDSNRILYITRESSPYMSYVHGNLLYSLPPNVLITIYGERLESYFIDSALITIFKDLEQSAKDMLGRMSMELNQYHPFAATIASPHVGGDVVAKLNKNGTPLQGQKVYFFLTNRSAGLIYEPGCFVMPNMGAGFSASGPFAGLLHNYAVVETDKSGEATFNYIASGALKPLLLGQMLDRHRGLPAVFVITAVVFDQDPITYWNDNTTKEPQAQAMSEVQIDFDSIARITKIIPTDPVQFPAPDITVKRTGAAYVPVNANQVNGVVSQPDGLVGYPLNFNDSVLPTKYTALMIQWLTGTTLLFTPKFDWDWKNNGDAIITIGFKDSGMYDRINTSATYFWGMGAAGFAGFIASCKGIGVAAAPAWGWASAILGGVGCVAISIGVYDKYNNPLIVQYKSQILFDLNETSTIYTVEGTATYYNSDSHSKVNVTTGRKLSVTVEGKEGTPVAFKESDLNAGMTSLLKTMQQQLTTGQTAINAQTTTNPTSNLPGPNNDSLNDFFKNSTTGPSPTWLLWLMIGIAALLIAMAILIQVQRKRRKLAPALSQSLSVTPSKPTAPVFPVTQTKQPQVATGHVCTKCGTPSQTGDPYCSACGSALVSKDTGTTVIEPQTLQFCLKCGFQTRPGKKYCGRCGNDLQAQIPATKPPVTAYCYKCGNPETEGSFFCRKCGAKLML